MRFRARYLMAAAALLLPTGAVAVNAGPAWAVGTTCAHTNGTATFKPPLPKSGDSTTVIPVIVVKNGKSTGCSGGGVTSSTFTSKIKFHDPTNCDILLSGNPSPNPPTGKIFATWNTAETSTLKVTLKPVSGQVTQTHAVGKVVAGKFLGLKVDQTLQFAPKTGDCITTDLSQVTFSEVTPLKIS
jgi:hypothetical protein